MLTKYRLFAELPALLEQRLIRRRKHPRLPLWIYNYTPQAQFLPITQWSPALRDCRGLILDADGNIVGRPFPKFWNYEQVFDDIPGGPFVVWEKLDGSLGIICSFSGERVVATRGSFESDQAKWLAAYLDRRHPDFYPSGETYLVEIVYPENRIVVDYGDTSDVFLLAVLAPDAADLWGQFDACARFRKAGRFDGIEDFTVVDRDPRFAGQEGFVVQWSATGLRAKIKAAEYKRLHRLVTQCSTRTIWEMLRHGHDTQELLDRVPADFAAWVRQEIADISGARAWLVNWASSTFLSAPACESRKEYAEWAKQHPQPGLLFLLRDGKDITDTTWKMVEPRWATPFRGEDEK